MKKAVLLLFFTFFLGCNVFAQRAHKHSISFGPSAFTGLAVNYEYMVLPNFSLVADTGFTLSVLLNMAFNASIQARWFPVSNSKGEPLGFFVSGGLGCGGILTPDRDGHYEINGLMSSVGIGHKLGIGKRRGFVLNTIMDFNVAIGRKTFIYSYYDEFDNRYENRETKLGVGFNPNFKLLFGWAF